MKNLILLGSTGSLGRQVLDVVRRKFSRFKVIGLCCGENVSLLKKQVEEFRPKVVCVGKDTKTQKHKIQINSKDQDTNCKKKSIPDFQFPNVKILYGEKGLTKLAAYNGSKAVLVNCLSGAVGLKPTLAAIKSGKNIIMANKESIVMAGEILFKEARKNKVSIIPLDSEHTSIFKILQGVKKKEVSKVILTCSGGPFLGKKKKDLKNVSVKEVLNHPTWKMGKKITVDSATLVNKGLEVIEAQKFFGLNPSQIDVVIHPESLVHCLVYLKNGEILAEVHRNDMRISIEWCLNFACNSNVTLKGCKSLTISSIDAALKNFTFKKPDFQTFEGLKLGFEVLKKGGLYPAVYSIADEIAVSKFLRGEIRFLDIVDEIKMSLRNYKDFPKKPTLKNIIDLVKSV